MDELGLASTRMPTYKLIYFDAKGLGEAIRCILSYMGADWEEERIATRFANPSIWKDMKEDVKYGKLPILEVDGKQQMYQSAAICRYLASEAGLLGSNAWENLQIDSIVDSFKDLVIVIQGTLKTQDEAAKTALRETVRAESLPYYLNLYEETMKENNGYLANGKLSWADFYVVGYLESAEAIFGGGIFDKYPNLGALKEKLYNIPNVKKWIDKRPKTF
ncbi:hypothetical protein GE061_016391 [Apolygus lucorum]|uniref:glutathione transferase n=1 Tax=Apolygus lucorum TaxID=248454 RepID=A0A6A4JVC5_APOLU|nr:hypothetical protein GE061_016391 [Apolygus lucorum]